MKYLFGFLLFLVLFASGVVCGFWLGTKDSKNVIDYSIENAGKIIHLLYDENGSPRSSQWTKDAMMLDLANSLIISGNSPNSANIRGNELLLKDYVNFVISHGVLSDVREADARELAVEISRCVSAGKHDGVCPEPKGK